MTYGPTKEEFVSAFLEVWKSVLAKREGELVAAYNNRRLWTELMCGERSSLSPSGRSILQMTLEQLRVNGQQIEFDRERHKVDAYGRVRVGSDRGDFTDCMNAVMVEVENDVESSHEEFWKLLHSRCQLKILITYDYNSKKIEEDARSKFESMYREATPILGPDPASYLLVIGGRKDRSPTGPIEWRFWDLKESGRFELMNGASR